MITKFVVDVRVWTRIVQVDCEWETQNFWTARVIDLSDGSVRYANIAVAPAESNCVTFYLDALADKFVLSDLNKISLVEFDLQNVTARSLLHNDGLMSYSHYTTYGPADWSGTCAIDSLTSMWLGN